MPDEAVSLRRRRRRTKYLHKKMSGILVNCSKGIVLSTILLLLLLGGPIHDMHCVEITADDARRSILSYFQDHSLISLDNLGPSGDFFCEIYKYYYYNERFFCQNIELPFSLDLF